MLRGLQYICLPHVRVADLTVPVLAACEQTANNALHSRHNWRYGEPVAHDEPPMFTRSALNECSSRSSSSVWSRAKVGCPQTRPPELTADFQMVEIGDLSKIKSSEWLEKQPFGQMPYVVDEETGAVIYESRAIVRCEPACRENSSHHHRTDSIRRGSEACPALPTLALADLGPHRVCKV